MMIRGRDFTWEVVTEETTTVTSIPDAPAGMLAHLKITLGANGVYRDDSLQAGTLEANSDDLVNISNTDYKLTHFSWSDNGSSRLRPGIRFGSASNSQADAVRTGLLSTHSMYVHAEDTIYEFAFADSYRQWSYIAWAQTTRPSNVGSGDAIEIIIANAGQSSVVEGYINNTQVTVTTTREVTGVLMAKDIESFVFDYGARFSNNSTPLQFPSHGTLTLNKALARSVAKGYKKLKVSKGATTYFVLDIYDYAIRREDKQTLFKLRGVGASRAKQNISWGWVPTAANLYGDFAGVVPAGITITTFADAVLPALQVSADPEWEQRRTPLNSFLSALAGTFSCMLLEDPSADTPTWIALPLPITASSDTRAVVGDVYGPVGQLILRRGYAVHESAEWQADLYFNANSRVDALTKKVTQLGRRNLASGKGPTAWPGSTSRYHYKRVGLGDGALPDDMLGFRRATVRSGDGRSAEVRSWVEDDLKTLHVYYRHLSDSKGLNIEYYPATAVKRGELERHATGVEESAKRTIGGNVTLSQADGNGDKVQELVDKWNGWDVEHAIFTMMSESADDDSAVARKAGDRVHVKLAGDNNVYEGTITNVQWRMRGDEPLHIRWGVVLQALLRYLRFQGGQYWYLGTNNQQMGLEG